MVVFRNNARSAYSKFQNSTFDAVDLGDNWTMARFAINTTIPKIGAYVLYTITGTVRVRGHVYLYACQIHESKPAVRDQVASDLRKWLDDFSSSTRILCTRSNAFFDILQVGEVGKKGRTRLSDAAVKRILEAPLRECRTAGNEKAAGIDVSFKHPGCFECVPGNQPHVIYKISKIYGKELQVGFGVGVWKYDETLMQAIREVSHEEIKDDESVAILKDAFIPKGDLIGCGITKIEGQNALWLTTMQEGERLGLSLKTICRTFLIPTTSGKCLCPSFSVGAVDAETFPVGDFEKFMPVGMRYVNSFTFQDKAQIRKQNGVASKASGTGWFVTPEHVVTCWHVIEGGTEFGFLGNDGKSAALRLVGRDEFSDLAVLRVVDERDQCKVPLRLSKKQPKVAESVFTVGYPLPEFMGKVPKYTEGVISALSGLVDDETLLQTTTPVQSGNSGGALLNGDREVIAVVQRKLSDKADEGVGVQSVSYAVKVFLLKRLLSKLSIALPENKQSDPDKYECARKASVFVYSK